MKSFALILSLFTLCLFACEKTIDSETNRWNRNQARLERIQLEYPNFSSAIKAQLQEATTIYEQAQQLSEEEAKIEMMAKANRTAVPRYITQLDNLDKKEEALRESSIELIEYAENNKGVLVAGLKSMNVENVIKESRTYLSSVIVNNPQQAEQVISKAIGKLDRLQKSISTSLRKGKAMVKNEE